MIYCYFVNVLSGVNEEILRRHYAKHDEGFFMFCDKEVSKVNTFFAGMCSCFEVFRYF